MTKPIGQIITKIMPKIKQLNWQQTIVEINTDDENFAPLKDRNENSIILRANVDEIIIQPNGICKIDCGFSIKVKNGYVLNIKQSDNLINGLSVIEQIDINDGRIYVNIKNILENKVINIKKYDKIALLLIEPFRNTL